MKTTALQPTPRGVFINVDVSGSSSVHHMVFTTIGSKNMVHIRYKSNVDVVYLYTLAPEDVTYLLAQAMYTDSAGQLANLIKKVSTFASKIDGDSVEFLVVNPMPLAEAVLA